MTNYEEILKGKYPAKAHAKRVVEFMHKSNPKATGVLYLEGQKAKLQEDNDENVPFRQRRNFFYLSGCSLPDAYLTYDITTQKSTLFIPPIDPDSVIWSGLPVSPNEALERYDVDEVLTSNELNPWLCNPSYSKGKTIYAIPEQISSHITFLEFDDKDWETLRGAIEDCRVQKDEYEVAMIRKANAVSREGHEALMGMVKHARNERELEGKFLERSVAQGAKNQAYHSIVASGRAAATLHYTGNDMSLSGKENLLVDAGAEWDCYASDITRTYPITGTFSPTSLDIYRIVLLMQTHCISMLQAGVLWEDVHMNAHRIAISGLLELGILQGDGEEILKNRTSVAFFPHGLGHYLGMDTHDVGGNANYEDEDSMFKYLRIRGKIRERGVLTVEPGIYFCKFIIEPYLRDPVHGQFINKEVLNKYWDVGGVRIEDNLLVTEDGCANLTDVVKDIDGMEKLISGS